MIISSFKGTVQYVVYANDVACFAYTEFDSPLHDLSCFAYTEFDSPLHDLSCFAYTEDDSPTQLR